MQAFDLFLYALAIITVLLLRAEPTPTPVATEPQPELEPIIEAKPAPTVAAAITTPAAVAVVKVATPDYSTLKTPQLRKLCSQRSIVWRNALGQNKHLPKAAMVEALLAS